MIPYYDKDGIKIYCDDYFQIINFLKENFQINTVLTDPPYGIKRFEKGFGYTRFKNLGVEKEGIDWDKNFDKSKVKELLNIGKYHIIWGANNFELPPSESFLVWNKKQTVPNFAQAELAYSDIPKLTAKVYEYSIHRHNKIIKKHPTQKPVSLMEWCISFLPEDSELILDPFMGSGTTLVAAKNKNINAIGIDISEEYCKIAVERLKEKKLFQIPKKENLFT